MNQGELFTTKLKPRNRKEYRRAYYLKHQERLRQYSREYARKFRARHGEDYLIKDREYRHANREKILKRAREIRENNRDRWKNYTLKRYGLTLIQYREMLFSQNNSCAICGVEFSSKQKPQVDHCHTTGKARKILCVKCNMMIAVLEYPPDLLDTAVEYLKHHRTGVLK